MKYDTNDLKHNVVHTGEYLQKANPPTALQFLVKPQGHCLMIPNLIYTYELKLTVNTRPT